MGNNVLIVAAHPDDELLWMWWTIAKLIANWDKVSILLLSKPGNARANNSEADLRLANFKTVSDMLWINNLYFESFPDTSFDSVSLLDIIKKIEEVLLIEKPDTVYTHFFNDLNIDHSITSKAVITALRPIEKYSFVKKIFLFEVLSSTELSIWNDKFISNYYENIEKFIDKKKKLLTIYESELRDFPHPRSIEGVEILAKKRWMDSWLKYAEAFMLYRWVND